MRSLDGTNAMLVSSPATVLVAAIAAWALSLGLAVPSFLNVPKKLHATITSALTWERYWARLAKVHSRLVSAKSVHKHLPLNTRSISTGCDAFRSACVRKKNRTQRKAHALEISPAVLVGLQLLWRQCRSSIDSDSATSSCCGFNVEVVGLVPTLAEDSSMNLAKGDAFTFS